VSNLARPGGNITGVSGFSPELTGKHLELIREIVPRVERIGVLVNRANPAAAPVLRATEAAAQQMRLRLHVVEVRQPADVPAAFDALTRARSEAFLVVTDPLLFSEAVRISELAARHRLPAVYEARRFPEAGGLMSYGALSRERFQQMAAYVDRILRGSRPGELPFERPRTFELVLNLKAARALGVEIPPALRLRADHVIE
jgi:putative ABC transport system substrate-binding protein